MISQYIFLYSISSSSICHPN